MHGEFLKCDIFQQMAPIKALFVASPLGFGGLPDDINIFCHEMILLEVIKEIVTANSTRPNYNYSHENNLYIKCKEFS